MKSRQTLKFGTVLKSIEKFVVETGRLPLVTHSLKGLRHALARTLPRINNDLTATGQASSEFVTQNFDGPRGCTLRGRNGQKAERLMDNGKSH